MCIYIPHTTGNIHLNIVLLHHLFSEGNIVYSPQGIKS